MFFIVHLFFQISKSFRFLFSFFYSHHMLFPSVRAPGAKSSSLMTIAVTCRGGEGVDDPRGVGDCSCEPADDDVLRTSASLSPV